MKDQFVPSPLPNACLLQDQVHPADPVYGCKVQQLNWRGSRTSLCPVHYQTLACRRIRSAQMALCMGAR